MSTFQLWDFDEDEQACTLCVVRPHVVRDGELGAVLSFVSQRGFRVRWLTKIKVPQLVFGRCAETRRCMHGRHACSTVSYATWIKKSRIEKLAHRLEFHLG